MTEGGKNVRAMEQYKDKKIVNTARKLFRGGE